MDSQDGKKTLGREDQDWNCDILILSKTMLDCKNDGWELQGNLVDNRLQDQPLE